MALRSEYALGHSEFNEFLFAVVGEEKSGQQLTVLSALARLGFDPWGEAARLAALPREAATQALAAAIGKLPEGDWNAADALSIAGHLIGCLPKRRSAAAAASQQHGYAEVERKSGAPKWLIWLVLGAALFVAYANWNASIGAQDLPGAARPGLSQFLGATPPVVVLN